MPPSADRLSKLLLALYGAASDASLWPVFLQELCVTAGASSAAFLMHDPAQSHHTVAVHSGADPQIMQLYADHYGARDVWVQKAYPQAHAGWTAVSEEICGGAELQQTEFYNDYLIYVGIEHAMWAMIDDPRAGRTNNLGIYRSRNQDAFQPHDTELLRFLTPHLRQGFKLHFQFAASRGLNENLQTALDQLSTAVVLLDARGRILSANRAATKLLAEADGLHLTREGIRAKRADESAKFLKLIADSQSAASGKTLAAGGAVTISRKGRLPLHLVVSPLRGVWLDNLSVAGCAIAFIHDPTQKARTAEEVLRTLFNLTPAECRLAQLIGDGHSPSQISAMLGVSPNTLKSQLASIYQKTHTSRQSQLVRLLARLSLNGNILS